MLKLLKYLKKYWIFAVIAPLFMCGEVFMDLLQPRLMSIIVDEGVLGISNQGVGNLNLVILTGLKMIFFVAIGGVCGVLSGVFANQCSQNFGNDIRKEAFGRIMSFSFEQTDQFSTGSLITRVTNDITQLQNFVMQCIRGFVRTFVLFFGGIISMLMLDLNFGVVVICAFPFIIVMVVFFISKANPMFGILQKKLDSVNNVIQENVAGSRVVKAYVKEEYEKERFQKANGALIDTQLQILILLSYMTPLMNIVLNISIIAIIKVGAIEVQAGAATPGNVMAAITYLSQILNALMRMTMIFQTASRGIASGKRVQEVLDCIPTIQSGTYTEQKEQELNNITNRFNSEATNNSKVEDIRKSGNKYTKNNMEEGKDTKIEKNVEKSKNIEEVKEKVRVGSKVEFKDVSFSYPESNGQLVLNQINLIIYPGETFAILGSTGCGKSSLVNLIPRFYDATKGQVLIDDRDVKEYDLTFLRKKIAIALQKSEIFSTTIGENIQWGDKYASKEEVERAAHIAQAMEFIEKKQEGMNTLIAEKGMSLSGGQKQRLAISRAILKKANILIFDDTTSALDLKTEARLYEELNQEYNGITKIIIAQRIASVKNADRIAILEHGRIAACDTHENLLKYSEIYQDIYESQLKTGGGSDE